MKAITLTISDIARLNLLRGRLTNNKPIPTTDKRFLADILGQIPVVETLLIEKTPLREEFNITMWDITSLERSLEKWQRLFANIPGYDYVSCWFVQNEETELLKKNVIMTVDFAPTMSYNASHLDGYYIDLKDDGTALFQLPTLQDAEKYPELYNFKGTWKEAYYLLIETLKRGWPMEEFPDELLPLLKK